MSKADDEYTPSSLDAILYNSNFNDYEYEPDWLGDIVIELNRAWGNKDFYILKAIQDKKTLTEEAMPYIFEYPLLFKFVTNRLEPITERFQKLVRFKSMYSVELK